MPALPTFKLLLAVITVIIVLVVINIAYNSTHINYTSQIPFILFKHTLRNLTVVPKFTLSISTAGSLFFLYLSDPILFTTTSSSTLQGHCKFDDEPTKSSVLVNLY